MGTATSSTSLLGGASRIGAYIQQRTTATFPFGARSSMVSTPPLSPPVVQQLETSGAGRRGRTANLSVLWIRCSHDHRPDLCPILPTPKGAKGNRLDTQGEHLWVLGLL